MGVPMAPPPSIQARFEGVFHQHCEGKPYLTAIEAAAVFMQAGQQTGLTKADLSSIWEQADADRDGRFTMGEFVHAMWLMELQGASPCPPYQASPQASAPVSPFLPRAFPPRAALPPFLPQTFPPQPPQAAPMKMSKAMICAGCEAGILPDDIIFHCAECSKPQGLGYCERCVSGGARCPHGLGRVKLEEHELPIRDKDGSWLMGVKCIKCKTKMRKKDLCFKCSHCWDPDFCPSCWRDKDKRCKHAARGKVKMCRVGRKDDGIEDMIDGVVSVLGG
ncbi:hypothetical protein JDV02_003881 [Purpureocillium takamizusanense]|uniref:EF-hand domain-containing protein n=1 Tax=Purpureocillium takamizusanense TaxID=2060973 RepID=A0A9Q8QDN9_9HYPO|nr:uncharacterized protein JDV02_003881 [Purpureocillium takamizusanense]UNI17548.1 hypothetical protein JDV02_003881 [Purpureocillium takamizusanense]